MADGEVIKSELEVTVGAIDAVERLKLHHNSDPASLGLSLFLKEWNSQPLSLEFDDFVYVFFSYTKLLPQPIVNKHDLKMIWEAMEQSVASAEFEYVVTKSGVLRGYDESPTREVSMALKPHNSIVTIYALATDGTRYGQSTISNDGIVREYDRPDAGRGTSRRRKQLETESLIDVYNPLCRAYVSPKNMPLNQYSDRIWKSLMPKQAVPIIETASEFNGFSCITLGDVDELIYLCPGMNYALVGIVWGKYKLDRGSGNYLLNSEYTVYSNTDFEEMDGGLWLPRKSVKRKVSAIDGEVLGEERVEVKSMFLNREIDTRIFRDAIPDGIIMNDLVNKVRYRIGSQDKSITGSIVDSIKRPEGYRYWIWVWNIVAVLVLIAISFSKRYRVER